MRVTFLGTGVMGSGMVLNLLAAGHDVTVFNRTPQRAAPLIEKGAARAGSLAEAVRGAEVVMYCLSDDAAIDDLVLGDGGVAEHLREGQGVVDLSTVSPDASAREREAILAVGAWFVDAPVFGSRGEATGGGLWVVVGGSPADVERARPVLEPISSSVHVMGGPGAGVRMKLVGNMLVASQLLALGEALTLARRSGLDLQRVLGVLDVTDFRTPIYSGVGRNVLAGDYDADFALRLLVKDLGLVRDLATAAGVDSGALEAVSQTAREALEAGFGDENASALIKIIAARAGTDLGKPDPQ